LNGWEGMGEDISDSQRRAVAKRPSVVLGSHSRSSGLPRSPPIHFPFTRFPSTRPCPSAPSPSLSFLRYPSASFDAPRCPSMSFDVLRCPSISFHLAPSQFISCDVTLRAGKHPSGWLNVAGDPVNLLRFWKSAEWWRMVGTILLEAGASRTLGTPGASGRPAAPGRRCSLQGGRPVGGSTDRRIDGSTGVRVGGDGSGIAGRGVVREECVGREVRVEWLGRNIRGGMSME
jgi:hypothetical protein